MKKYTTSIEKLYETTGFEKLEIGKTYLSGKGEKITINNIYIDATSDIAEAHVNFSTEKDGNTLTESNTFNVVVKILRDK